MAILVATVKIKDLEKFQQYAASVPSTMEPFGGKLLGRGKVIKGIDGDVSFQVAAMFEFPDAESEPLQSLVVHEMGSAMDLEVPLEVSVQTGSTWAECEK